MCSKYASVQTRLSVYGAIVSNPERIWLALTLCACRVYLQERFLVIDLLFRERLRCLLLMRCNCCSQTDVDMSTKIRNELLKLTLLLITSRGRAVAQAVSYRLPTAAIRIRTRIT
jgi:hypothetical protein